MSALLQHGHRDVLGFADGNYWAILEQNFGHMKPTATQDSIPLQFYGDEIQVWDGVQYMCMCWISEVSPFMTDPAKSRFLICAIPANCYLQHGDVNLTLQEALRHIVCSFNLLYDQGVEQLSCEVTCIKGDRKFIRQALSLTKHYGKDRVCCRCEATKSLMNPYTDISSNASWRWMVAEPPWDHQPALCGLNNFSLMTVAPDTLHVFHLGVGRDLLSSTMVILLKSNAFPGPNVGRLA